MVETLPCRRESWGKISLYQGHTSSLVWGHALPWAGMPGPGRSGPALLAVLAQRPQRDEATGRSAACHRHRRLIGVADRHVIISSTRRSVRSNWLENFDLADRGIWWGRPSAQPARAFTTFGYWPGGRPDQPVSPSFRELARGPGGTLGCPGHVTKSCPLPMPSGAISRGCGEMRRLPRQPNFALYFFGLGGYTRRRRRGRVVEGAPLLRE